MTEHEEDEIDEFWMRDIEKIQREYLAALAAKDAEIARLRAALSVFADDEADDDGCSWDWTRDSLFGRRCGYAWMHPIIENPADFARKVLEGKP